MSEAQKAINDEILTVVMLESPEAIKNADGIASVDGIDVLLIGSFDLTSEMGIPGQMGHQKLIDACQAVGDARRRHGKALGVGGSTTMRMRGAISGWVSLHHVGQRSQLHRLGLTERAKFIAAWRLRLAGRRT
jgi:2-keto-3-deoxy-L-rhamnonate aldolase RhmA